MNKTILTGILAAFACTAAQAQQATNAPLSNKAPEVKERQITRTSEANNESTEVRKKDQQGVKVSTSATAPSEEKANRDHSATAPRLENKTYHAMSPQERSAKIDEIEAIIHQNEGNPNFNREVYQKRIDHLKEMK